MALQITITYGSTTIDLQAGGYTVLDGFYPQSPTKDGSLSEKIDLEIIGSSESDLSAKIRALELALEYARTHEGWQSAWLNFSPSTTLATWRDKIMDGAVLYDARLLKRWREKKAIVSPVMRREGSWNGAEVQIPLSNPNGTADTTGLRVYNCNDGATVDSTYKQNNYVDIAGASVLGDLPGATRLEITNLFAGTGEPMMVWIGHNFTNPSTFVWNFEGEDAEIGGSPADVADANSSSGYYENLPGFYGNGFFNKAFKWTLSSAQLDAAAGRLYHVLARFASSTYITDFRYQLTMDLISGASTLAVWSGPVFYLDTSVAHIIRDLGVVRLPPKLAGYSGLAAHKLNLEAAFDDLVATKPLAIDFIQLVPADGWRFLEAIAHVWPTNYRLADDGINGDIWLDNGAGAERTGAWVGTGKAIELQPGKDQRLSFNPC